MIFLNDEKVYFSCFDFLISDYGYKITYENTDEGIHFSKIILEKNNSPNIKIEIERGYLVVYLYIQEEEWALSLLYKFLHHDEIVRCKFGNSKVIKNYFEEVTRKYLDNVLENFCKLNNQDLTEFYKEFPAYVFSWS